MLPLDRAAAGLVLAGTGGVLAFRALRAWLDFRLQQRTLELTKLSVARLERAASLAAGAPRKAEDR